ncbi:hypothetical protein JMF97_19465 [Micromonospora fiedleri]|uniref:Uncharacterized protein n=1 Tax=Micromonospora fiedleri TaxID=1157498 RepID=A0ABS1UPU3_9ACTN|nr:hypothetical protein [Micromonospora fiedleri]MBL6278342.1 hypothetical protein [Micromonospora fiedleri]
MTRPLGRNFLLFSGLLLLAGSMLQMNGGRRHPAITEEMGTFGSDEFMLSFAKLMVNEKDWQLYHEQMLAGPLLWAIGCWAVILLARQVGDSRWTPMGFIALAMGAVLWVLTYMYDGWVSPETAKALLAAQGDETLAAAITQTYASGQWFTIRVGIYSWLLVAFGTALLSIGVINLARSYSRGIGKPLAWFLGGFGLFLGLWSLVGWLSGNYYPGPMVSLWWLPANIATQFWFTGLSILVLLHAFGLHQRGDATPVSPAPTEQPVAKRA